MKKPVYNQLKFVQGTVRFTHAFVDGFVLFIIFQIMYSIFPDIDVLILLLLFLIYYFGFEFFLQKTPGKYLTKSIVIDEFGDKANLRSIILRTILRLVPFEQFSCLSETGWHDRWSKTYIVKEEELYNFKELGLNR